MKEKIILALDVQTADEARRIVETFNGKVGVFKVGLQLFTAAGPAFVKELASQGVKIFLDLKFHDIPNTVASASIEAARLGVWMFNVHAIGGGEMMRAAVDKVNAVCEAESLTRPKIIAVTVLTSSNGETLNETGIAAQPAEQVLNLAQLTSKCGLDGVVASPHEISLIREHLADKDFLIVTPGVRPDFATSDDQKRVVTPGEAILAGTDHLVIGRPILKAADPLGALQRIIEEMETASAN
jgi:orotidine-5'-phosphate decarboxylase